MSKLYKAIEMSKGEKVFIPRRFTVEQTFERTGFPMAYATIHKIRLQLNSQVVLDDADRDAHAMAIKGSKEALVRMVFEEYMEPLREVLHSLHNQDLRRARLIIASVMDNFMSTEAYAIPPEAIEKDLEITS